MSYFLTQTEMDAAFVAKTLFDAQTLLAATTDNNPTALALAEQTLLGRAAGGNVKALSVDEASGIIKPAAITTAVSVALAAVNWRQPVLFTASPTLTLPDPATNARSEYLIINIGVGTGTLGRNGGSDTINGIAADMTIGPARGAVWIKSNGIDGWYIPDLLIPGLFNSMSTYFNGIDTHANVPSPGDYALEYNIPWSLSWWFKTDSTSGQAMFGKFIAGLGTNKGVLSTVLGGSQRISFVLHNADTVNEIGVYSPILDFYDAAWHNVVWTYDGSSTAAGVKLYWDSVPKTLTVNKDTLSATIVNTRDIVFGAYETENEPSGYALHLDGNLDEMAIWDAELSAANATEIYNAGAPQNLLYHTAAANLVGWWRMGDGDTAPTITDRSVNSNDATMVNMDATNFKQDVP